MSWPQTPGRGMLPLPRHVVRGAHHERERPQEATARRTDRRVGAGEAAPRFDGGLLLNASRVNSSATIGTEPAGIQRYSMDINPLTYAGFSHPRCAPARR